MGKRSNSKRGKNNLKTGQAKKVDKNTNEKNEKNKGEKNMATISFDRKIVLNDVSAESLAKKIEYDKKNTAVLKDINIEKKIKEGKELLKQLFSR